MDRCSHAIAGGRSRLPCDGRRGRKFRCVPEDMDPAEARETGNRRRKNQSRVQFHAQPSRERTHYGEALTCIRFEVECRHVHGPTRCFLRLLVYALSSGEGAVASEVSVLVAIRSLPPAEGVFVFSPINLCHTESFKSYPVQRKLPSVSRLAPNTGSRSIVRPSETFSPDRIGDCSWLSGLAPLRPSRQSNGTEIVWHDWPKMCAIDCLR